MHHFQHFSANLRKARWVVIDKSKHMGARTVTDLKEPAHSVRWAHIYVRSIRKIRTYQ